MGKLLWKRKSCWILKIQQNKYNENFHKKIHYHQILTIRNWFHISYENISFTFSKNDFSELDGCGIKFSSSSNFLKNSFWSFESFFGVHTLIWTNISPFPYLSRLWTPFPLNLNIIIGLWTNESRYRRRNRAISCFQFLVSKMRIFSFWQNFSVGRPIYQKVMIT